MTTYKHWLWVELTSEEKAEAEEYARREDELCRDKPWAIHIGGTSLDNNIVGAYGMWAVRRYFDENHIPYEIGSWGGLFEFRIPIFGTVDIKTKRVNTQPRPNYATEVRELHINHEVNNFLFCYWLEPQVIVLGWLEKDDFVLNSHLYKVGERRLGPDGQLWTCSEDCRLGEIRILRPVSELCAGGKQTGLL